MKKNLSNHLASIIGLMIFIVLATGSIPDSDEKSSTSSNTYQKYSTPKTFYVKVAKANVRKGGGTKHSIITTKSRGGKLTVLGKDGSWYHVKLSEYQNGWIYKTLVSSSKTVAQDSKTQKTESRQEKGKFIVTNSTYTFRNVKASIGEIVAAYFTAKYESIGKPSERIKIYTKPDPYNPVATLVIFSMQTRSVQSWALEDVTAEERNMLKKGVPKVELIWRVNSLMDTKITPYNWYARDSIEYYKLIVDGIHVLSE